MPASKKIRNPVLPGFYPDPSICRVGNDFYLVNSSFAFFPGIPVFHSRDLVSWRQIGNALDRRAQLPLDGASSSRGLFAPTIRYSSGVFYLICTNIDNGGNFFVTAPDPSGPWSDPVWLPSAPGIDPSLFFDDDGRVWYTGTRPVPEGPAYDGNWEIWLREIDVLSPGSPFRGESRGIWRGALRDCIWPEGPHLYKRNGYYYLLIAEGGTGPDHAITVARSRDLAGPWSGKPSNPLLTHRHLGKKADIVNVGHGDLFDDAEGNWWMTLLASRPYGEEPLRGSNLGRETFIVPVVWEDDWPVASPETGLVCAEYGATAGSGGSGGIDCDCGSRTAFDQPVLPFDWIFLRVPQEGGWSLSARPGFLRLRLLPGTLRKTEPVSFGCVRQRHIRWKASLSVDFTPRDENECAGLAVFRNENFQYRLEICLVRGVPSVRLVRAAGGEDCVVDSRPLPQGDLSRIVLGVAAEGQFLIFHFGSGAGPVGVGTLAGPVDGSILGTETAGGFTGTVIGPFATSNGTAPESSNHADFEWFEYGPA